MSLIPSSFDPADLVPQRFSSLLDRFFNENVGQLTRLNAFTPSVDVVETPERYELHVAVPGMKREDFKVQLNDGQLVISGERKFEKTEDGKTFHKVETQWGAFSRTFTLPKNVKRDGIVAEYKDGILNVHLPKAEESKQSLGIEVK